MTALPRAFQRSEPCPAHSKRCPKCKQTKDLGSFYLNLRTDTWSSYCRTCQRTSTRASYLRRRQDPAALELMRARDRDRKRQTRAAQKGGR